MAVSIERRYSTMNNPLHAIFLAGASTLFLSAALGDVAYALTYEIQWANFASWLIAGGLLFGGLAVVVLIFDSLSAGRRAPGIGWYGALLVAIWIVGFLNALMHARDAWASMPNALILSVITIGLVCGAVWFGMRTPHVGVAR